MLSVPAIPTHPIGQTANPVSRFFSGGPWRAPFSEGMVQLRELTRILILLLLLLSQSSADFSRTHPRPPSRSPKPAAAPILFTNQPRTNRDTLY
ncbi:MAG: hypothetical protein H7Y12_05725, partial [Sphingobacteriaceae bacterium]|nr:hypothetical protein [Cytophagaceae bacterium]